jgi:predicted aspartyl protease
MIYRPIIPLTIRKDEKRITVAGILDSGSDFMLLPKDIAEYLNLELSGDEEAEAIGEKIETKRSVIGLTITDGKATVYLRDNQVGVLMQDGLKEVIIGRIPFFSEFDITFRENSKRVELVRTLRR